MDAAGGLPVWLCSVSKRKRNGDIVPTGRWLRGERIFAERLINRVLDGAGDRSIERQFRMCVTLCRHRATTQAERSQLGDDFLCFRPFDIAGAPVEEVWTRGIPAELNSGKPCLSPTLQPIGQGNVHLTLPCNVCAACQSNDAVRARVDAFRAEHPRSYLLETV